MNGTVIDKGRKPLYFFRIVLAGVLPVILLLAFSALVLNHAFYFTMDADEAFNASIARNWVAGYGYSSSLGVIFPFDPYISSGPAYTFLQAIPVWIAGNDPDVQKPFIAAIHLLLFAAVLYQLHRHLLPARDFVLLVAFCLSSYLLLEFKFWHRPAGELLSLLYFINGALLFSDALASRRYMPALMAGLLLACACLTKTQAMLWILGLCIAAIIYACRNWNRRLPGVVLLFATGFLLPVLCWQYYKSAVMAEMALADPHLHDYAKGKDWHFFSTHGSGLYLLWEVDNWRDLVRIFSSVMQLAFNKLTAVFNGYGVLAPVFAAAVPLLPLLMLARWCRKNTVWLFLLLPLVVFLAWVFFLNNSVYTHQILPAVWLWILLLAIWCLRWPKLLLLLVLMNVSVLGIRAFHHDDQSCLISRDAACIHTGPNPVRESLKKAVAYLQQHDLPAPLANCGWYFAQDIEFSLPGINNIRDCMRLLDPAVEFDRDAFIAVNGLPEHFRESRTTAELISIYVNKRKNLFGGSFVAPIHWRQPVEFTFVAGIYMMGSSLEQQRNVMSFLNHCHGVLYKDDYYAVQYCSYQDLQAYVAEWGGLPIFTHGWEALYYADFMRTTRELRQPPVRMRPY